MDESEQVYVSAIETPLGILEVRAEEEGIRTIEFVEEAATGYPPVEAEDMQQLVDYFAGKRKTFDLKLAPKGTEFQQSVWEKLAEIPYGVTVSYLDIAKKIGNPKSTRAVGGANGKNPIALVLPCHRVIGSNQKLTGYGSGIWRKKWLLEFEKYGTQTSLFE